MALLKPNPVSVKQFTITQRDPRTLVGEHSSTNGFGRVYDDACDEGLTVIFEDGKEGVFAVDHEEWDREEGELISWHLKLVSRYGNEFFAPRQNRIILFND